MREDSSCGHNRNLMGEAGCHGSSVGSSAERSEDGRPVSVVSSVSSCSSVEGNISRLTPSPSAGDIDLELNPPKEPADPPEPVITSSERRKDPPSPIATVAMAPNLTYVDRVVMEIIETERMYVRDLRSIVEDYLVHIIDSRDLPIKPEQVCSLFGNIEQIYEFNSELLHSLDACACDPVAIARCFVDKSEYFEIYTQYCTNYPNSVAVLTECLRNTTLAQFLRDRQASLRRSLPLGSYLLKPVQRILKYHLLLQEIAKHFDSEEDGYDVVIEAIDTMTGVAWYINDMKRKHEHAVRLQEIQSLLINWKGPDLTSYGELVLDGTFHVHRAKNERTLFLFDKMLLITKKRGEHYVYKTHISCSTLMLIESAKDSLRFSVTHYKQPKQPHTVQARTVEEKKLWAHHIKRLILENHHVVIPQKAKDAILDVDSTCLVKHRYSPDRMKKATSCRVDDFSACALKERRRSEPGKQITRSSRGLVQLYPHVSSLVSMEISHPTTVCVTQHADSEGALLVVKERRSLPPAADGSALTSEMRENQQDLESSTGSLYDPDETRPHGEREEDQKNADDGGEDEQVADFTTSVLAALSCLQYRARALLSHPITTLARQYSQRIRNSRPVVRQRPKATESHFMPKSLSSFLSTFICQKQTLNKYSLCVGLPDRTLSLDLNEQDLVQDSESTSPSSGICSPESPQFPYFCRLNIQRPQSPVQVESFHWPDVKELCSKYSNQGQKSVSHHYPMGHSVSFPERMLDHERERSKTSRTLSCSSSCNFTTQRATNTNPESVPSLCRVNSLDHNLETQHAREQPDSCCVTGHRTLSREIMVEKVCRVKLSLETEDSSEGQVRWDAVAQSELSLIDSTEQHVRFGAWVRGGQQSCSTKETETSQHNLVKNLREKFQNLSSYT
ncbi:putative pleckstrin homology domain-containing family G member 3-like [Triplophysa rosa]|uniref:Pleckstrin homology domain-containing family G member 3-like n=1 Tax=Triplophysa rosa TaxID=992332 RepID=A0A9W7TXJ8_TRIRA|nr:putative pleckstrin homology domain-containing family G member 3-like [Triplophysa rosa]